MTAGRAEKSRAEGFRDEQVARLDGSGWVRCGSVARAVAAAGLPAPTAEHLASAFPDAVWARAERAVRALEQHFASARFADETVWGILLVPAPGLLDTRRPMPASTRADQLAAPEPDVFDERLPLDASVLDHGDRPWTMVATVTGAYGPALGSWRDVSSAPAEAFTVDGRDSRRLMTRQLWGARVLQGGAEPPDCEANPRWTFTLFPGEGLTDGLAESGTVLHGRVRFRLGKPDRGIASARVAPALAVH